MHFGNDAVQADDTTYNLWILVVQCWVLSGRVAHDGLNIDLHVQRTRDALTKLSGYHPAKSSLRCISPRFFRNSWHSCSSVHWHYSESSR